MVSYPRRLHSGHFTCYLNRTYHVLTTGSIRRLASFTAEVVASVEDGAVKRYRLLLEPQNYPPPLGDLAQGR